MILQVSPGKQIELLRGDITRETTEAIVNAANSALLPGGGVCGAIHRAGGPLIARECAAYVREHGEVEPGKAAITGGGNLQARFVIHTVGPVWQGGRSGEPGALASCYRESMALADAMDLASIAFPSISTGIFGYPVVKAAPVAVNAIQEALRAAGSVRLVKFVLFDEATLHAYETAGRQVSH